MKFLQRAAGTVDFLAQLRHVGHLLLQQVLVGGGQRRRLLAHVLDGIPGQHTNVPFVIQLVEGLEQPCAAGEGAKLLRVLELDGRPAVEADAPPQRLVHLGRHVGNFDGGYGRRRVGHIGGLIAAVLPAHAAQVGDVEDPAEPRADVEVQRPVAGIVGALRAQDSVEGVDVEVQLDSGVG